MINGVILVERTECKYTDWSLPYVPSIHPEEMPDKWLQALKMTQSDIQDHPLGSSSEPDLVNPQCVGMSELECATSERARVVRILKRRQWSASRLLEDESDRLTSPDLQDLEFESSPFFTHLAHGLAYTTGSALGSTPPSIEACLAAYQIPNSAGLTAGSRAWSKHCHRSQPQSQMTEKSEEITAEEQHVQGRTEKRKHKIKQKREKSEGWWGTVSGPIPVINEKSLALFWKVMKGATWRNLHWLPHQVLVYEVRLPEGYGMRWAQDLFGCEVEENPALEDLRPWIFRGFLEPQMDNGHELGWRHTI